MDDELIRQMQLQYIAEQEMRIKHVQKHLGQNDRVLGTGNGRVEDYPGRFKPRHPHEDFDGFIAVTLEKFIYVDLFGEIVIPFCEVVKVTNYDIMLPATIGIRIKRISDTVKFSAQATFGYGIVDEFKNNRWETAKKSFKFFKFFSN